MPARTRRRASWAVAAAIVCAAAGGAGAMYRSLATQRASGADVVRAFEGVAALRRVLRLTTNAETGQRGYLLTGDPTFLEPYEAARGSLPGELARLPALGVIPPDHRIPKLVAAKLDELRATIALDRAGRRDEALRIVRSGVGKRHLDDLRTEVRRIDDRLQQEARAAIERSEETSERALTVLGLLTLFVGALSVLGISLIVRATRLEDEAVRLREVERAEKEVRLIARELNHRVKNLFAVVLAIIQLAGRGAASPAEAIARIRDRVHALARAHEVSLGQEARGVDLERLLRATLDPYARREGYLELAGPPVQLPVIRVTPLGMIVHELATNALKYGAWSRDGGVVRIGWSVGPAGDGSADRLSLSWEETGGPAPTGNSARGFGSKLIEAAVGQLGGRLSREWLPGGLALTLDAAILPEQAESRSDGALAGV